MGFKDFSLGIRRRFVSFPNGALRMSDRLFLKVSCEVSCRFWVGVVYKYVFRLGMVVLCEYDNRGFSCVSWEYCYALIMSECSQSLYFLTCDVLFRCVSVLFCCRLSVTGYVHWIP